VRRLGDKVVNACTRNERSRVRAKWETSMIKLFSSLPCGHFIGRHMVMREDKALQEESNEGERNHAERKGLATSRQLEPHLFLRHF